MRYDNMTIWQHDIWHDPCTCLILSHTMPSPPSHTSLHHRRLMPPLTLHWSAVVELVHDVLLVAGDSVGRLHADQVAPAHGHPRAVRAGQLVRAARAARGATRALGLGAAGLVRVTPGLRHPARNVSRLLVGNERHEDWIMCRVTCVIYLWISKCIACVPTVFVRHVCNIVATGMPFVKHHNARSDDVYGERDTKMFFLHRKLLISMLRTWLSEPKM